MSNPTPHRYGVVGHPVAHSLSPQIHAAFAAQTGEAIDYARILAPLDGFIGTARGFFDGGGRGINVTLPFKLEARVFCGDRVSDRAGRAGAVNCISMEADGPFGDNTDGAGLVDDLLRLTRSLEDARVLLLGAGGAARGVLGPLLGAGLRSLTVVNRNRAKAEAMVAACVHEVDAAAIEVSSLAALGDGEFDVVVNATSASLGGDALALPTAVFARARLVYDMMYAATPTTFLIQAERAGAEATADGLGMLVEQAAESFFIWRGIRPQTAPVREALRAMLGTTR